jgi:hypothetical protein
MVGQIHIAFGLITVFIAVFMLFFIFDRIDKIVKNCQSSEEPKICEECCKSSSSFPVLVIVLIVGAFTMIACVTAYILLTA